MVIWEATIVGFIGIIVLLQFNDPLFKQDSLVFALTTLLFNILNILNKKYVNKAPIPCILFYAICASILFTIPPTIYVWQTSTSYK